MGRVGLAYMVAMFAHSFFLLLLLAELKYMHAICLAVAYDLIILFLGFSTDRKS